MGLFGLIALAWGYLFLWDMPQKTMGQELWSLQNYIIMFSMWAVMMVAMMVPSALPMILLYAASVKKAKLGGATLAPLSIFILGYILIWTLFSAFAALLQLTLQDMGTVNMMMEGTHPWLMGGLLILAGLYQMSPWKDTCLRFCQHPVTFITKYWRTGRFGALKMGILHGGYCVGCCWALMLLLFIGGVMNLLWVAALAIYVLIEKIIPLPRRWPQISGMLMVLIGLSFGFTFVNF